MGIELVSGVLAALVSGLCGTVMLYVALRRVSAEADSREGEQAKPPACLGFFALSALLLTLLCAGIAAFMYFFYQDSLWSIWNALLLCAVLWACAVSDRKAMLIPNAVLLCGVGLRVVLLCMEAILLPEEIVYDLIGSAVAAAGLCVLTLLCRLLSRGAIGFGDIKLLTVMGLFLGLSRIWGSLLISMLCSFFYCVFLLITKRATGKTEIPFAPILLVGTVLSLFLTSV